MDERETERDRQTDRQRQRQKRQGGREREAERERERQRERATHNPGKGETVLAAMRLSTPEGSCDSKTEISSGLPSCRGESESSESKRPRDGKGDGGGGRGAGGKESAQFSSLKARRKNAFEICHVKVRGQTWEVQRAERSKARGQFGCKELMNLKEAAPRRGI
eukprot:1579711-Rhodomonas_salina.2